MGGSLALLAPGTYVAGIDLQDCSARWFAAPALGPFLRVCHSVRGRLEVRLFLPFGVSSSPERRDRCVEAALRVAPSVRPSSRIIDFADVSIPWRQKSLLRRLGETGEHFALNGYSVPH